MPFKLIIQAGISYGINYEKFVIVFLKMSANFLSSPIR